MFAVVLVGGFGTRLRPLTETIPKPMLPVAHRPMIVHLVERLGEGGVTDVVLALGFKPEPFRSAFPDGVHDGVRIHYAVEPEPLDTAGAIRFAADSVAVDDTFVVANGDIITDLPIDQLLAAHRRAGVDATQHLTEVDDPSAFGVVELGPDGIVERFVEKPPPGTTDSRFINAGTYVLEPAVLQMIPAGRRCSIERDVFPALVDARRLSALPTDHYWLDTGRPEQYLQANLDLIDGTRDHTAVAVHPGARVAADAVVNGSIVGDRAVVGSGAVLERSLVLPGGVVAEGARLERSIVAGTVESGASAVDAVVGAGATLAAGATLVGERIP